MKSKYRFFHGKWLHNHMKGFFAQVEQINKWAKQISEWVNLLNKYTFHYEIYLILYKTQVLYLKEWAFYKEISQHFPQKL